MKWRKAPGGVVNPGPTPRADPNPVTVVIRRPTDDHGAGNPDRAVIGVGLPLTVLIEVVIAVHVSRDVFCRARIVFELVTRLAPVFEVVEFRRCLRVVSELIGAGEQVLLPGGEIVSFTAAGYLAFTFANDDDGGIAVRIGLDAIFTGSGESERQIGRVYFESVARFEMAEVDFDGALGQLQLHRAIVEIEKRNAGLTGKANGGRANVNFATRIFVGPEIVASGQRTIGISFDPIVFTRGLERDGTLYVIQARYASGRIALNLLILLILVLRHGGVRQRQEPGDRQEHEQAQPQLSGHRVGLVG